MRLVYHSVWLGCGAPSKSPPDALSRCAAGTAASPTPAGDRVADASAPARASALGSRPESAASGATSGCAWHHSRGRPPDALGDEEHQQEHTPSQTVRPPNAGLQSHAQPAATHSRRTQCAASWLGLLDFARVLGPLRSPLFACSRSSTRGTNRGGANEPRAPVDVTVGIEPQVQSPQNAVKGAVVTVKRKAVVDGAPFAARDRGRRARWPRNRASRKFH